MAEKHEFGGRWTEEKLKLVKKYLEAYATIMNKQKFWFAYIDAFAGTGYRKEKDSKTDDQISLFQQDDIKEIETYSKGSARIALEIEPGFNKYIFIEKSTKYITELHKLKEDFPEKGKNIQLVNADANSYISDLCDNYKWGKHRAVMFLDPYGMQVNWKTIKAIANTEAIDLWYLFPLGIGVNRLLQKDIDRMPLSWETKLDDILGTNEWKDSFYSEIQEATLFGNETNTVKDTDFNKISEFIIEKLKSIFAGVAENPLLLRNSKNNPLYLLCFASGNPRGAKTAVKIAQNILKRK
ncbi:MAG: three-Cys-motif partner protein TcmP [Bacteroidetes bacterium]|nr:three-Cys-motif partner protein TcmP [Bacteroidota bacterium]